MRAYFNKLTTVILVIFTFSLFLPASPLSAETYNLRIKIIDELGIPLDSSSLPPVTLENCTSPTVVASKSLGNGVFELAVSTGNEDRICDLRVTSSQYLYSTYLSTGDTGAAYQDKTGTPITLYYRTRIIVKDTAENLINDAVVHHAGVSPKRISGGTYYFTTNTTGGLIVERSGFATDDGDLNTQLQSVAGGTESAATVVSLSSSAPCNNGNSVSAGSTVFCAALSPSFTLTVKNPSGDILIGASVKVYTDLARTTIANDSLTAGDADALSDTDQNGKAQFGLFDGRYYVRVEKFGYNDANLVVDTTNNLARATSVTLGLAGSNILSPGRSQVAVSPTSLPADNETQATFTIKIFDNNLDGLSRRNVSVISNRVEDTVTPLSAQTNNSGTVIFAVSSSKAGESVFTINAESITLSTFPKITFTVSAASLASAIPSASESKVEASVSPITSNGEAAITVTVKNSGGVLLSNKIVTLSSSRPGDDIITPTSASTDANGKATLKIKSNKSGTSVITVIAGGIPLKEMAVITFSPVGRFSTGSLLKSEENSAVYYYGADGKRHAFPNEKIYKSWYSDFSSVQEINASDLASLQLGKNVTYRPGVKMVKLQTVPKVYAIAKGGILRWVQSEELALGLYGADWNKKIDDLSDAFFTDYQEGSAIELLSGFNPSSETSSAQTIDDSL